jgi:hypothetical protein
MTKDKLISQVAGDVLLAFPHCMLERSAKSVTSLASGAETNSDGFSVQFCREGVSPDYWSGDCELTVGSDGGDIVQDEETGDIYRSYKLKFIMAWSSFNRNVTSDVEAKLQFMLTVTSAVADLARKYSDTYKVLVRTAAEEAERKVKAELATHTSRVKAIAEYMVKGLRVQGNAREVGRTLFTGIPDGVYSVVYHGRHDSKTYSVRLGIYGAKVWRTA